MLKQAIIELSERYRKSPTTPPKQPHIRSEAHRIAYLLSRFPGTFEALTTVLRELGLSIGSTENSESVTIHSVLDLGAGPGTALWAASTLWDSLQEATLIERDPDLIQLGQRLMAKSGIPILQQARWSQQNILTSNRWDVHDVVVISYMLNELESKQQQHVLHSAWKATQQFLVVVEPGTMAGFQNILAARSLLIKADAQILGPCPHQGLCPMEGKDWCHFSVRVPRSALLRRARSGTLAHDDEKFAYLIAARHPGNPCLARVVRHPFHRKGHIQLQLCTENGLTQQIVTRKNKEVFRRARHLQWGARWD